MSYNSECFKYVCMCVYTCMKVSVQIQTEFRPLLTKKTTQFEVTKFEYYIYELYLRKYYMVFKAWQEKFYNEKESL